MLKNKLVILILIFLLIQIFSGCSGVDTSKNPKTETKDMNFSEKDSEALADSIVNKIVNAELVSKFSSKRKPKIIVGSIRNLTTEIIDTNLLSKNIERSFLNSGKVTFISSKSKREIIRNDRKNRDDFEKSAELKKYLKPLKSDFFISGVLSQKTNSVSNSKQYKLELNVIKSRDAKLLLSEFETVNK